MLLPLVLAVGFFSVALANSVNKPVYVGLGDIPHLFATAETLYFLSEYSLYTLANDSQLEHENFDFHRAKGLAFFQPKHGIIASAPLQSNHSEYKTVVNVVSSSGRANARVSDFAVDWLHDRIVYKTSTLGLLDPTESMLVSVDLQGGDRKVLQASALSGIDEIAIDPHAGKIFWIQAVTNICSCNLDGSDYKIILGTAEKKLIATRLALDIKAKQIYFVATENSAYSANYTLNSIGYEGGQLQNDLYVWDKNSGDDYRDIKSLQVHDGKIYSSFTLGGKFFFQLINQGNMLAEVEVRSPDQQPVFAGKFVFIYQPVTEDSSKTT